MERYARLERNTVLETLTLPSGVKMCPSSSGGMPPLMSDEDAGKWKPCPPEVQPGWIYDDNGSFNPPVAPEPTPEETAQAEYATALAESTAILTARVQRQLVQAESFTPAEFATFAKAGLFPVWTPGVTYTTSQRIAHENIVYQVQQDHTSLAHQPPGSAGMLAVYRPISSDSQSGEEPDGSLENPIPFISGMDVFSGKYYAFEGALYLARADMIPCVWNPDTPGLWQWERI